MTRSSDTYAKDLHDLLREEDGVLPSPAVDFQDSQIPRCQDRESQLAPSGQQRAKILSVPDHHACLSKVSPTFQDVD